MKRITVKDIARDLGVSVGTVSKALNGRSGVGGALRARIAETARLRGYNANELAQGLARNPIRIGAVMPRVWREFYGYLEYGIRQELQSLADHKITGIFRYVANLNADGEYRAALDGFRRDSLDAAIVCPAFGGSYADSLDGLRAAGMPAVLLGAGMDAGARMTCVRSDSALAGRMAADFAYWLVRGGRSAAVFVGDLRMRDHAERLREFEGAAARKGCPVCGVYETQDDPETAYSVTEALVRSTPGLGAVYVATGNSVPVCRCLADLGASGEVKVIATDVRPDMRWAVESGVIQALIYQNPVRQGRLAVRTIYRYFSQGILPQEELLVSPELVLPSNYSHYVLPLDGSGDA